MCEICSKLIIKTPERLQWSCPGVFIVNFEQFTPCSSISIVDFGKINASWVILCCITDLFSSMLSNSLRKLQQNTVKQSNRKNI